MKQFWFLSWLLVFSLEALAYFPKSFKLSNTAGDVAVFVDFKKADYFIEYNVQKGLASYRAQIEFVQKESGHPIFDVVSLPSSVLLNNKVVNQKEISTPNNESKVRIVDVISEPGTYRLEVRGSITNLVRFEADQSGVRAAHWTSDLDDRQYLESFLPSNYEFDQYKMIFHVKVIGALKAHKIYSNGVVTKDGDNNHFVVEFPAYFTSSSGFYHLAPEGVYAEKNFIFPSLSGEKIPVTVYGPEGRTNFTTYQANTLKTLEELEGDYGNFKHKKVVIFNNGSGGMEYCGATMTDLWALAHELTHSYFARGILPANGNAGWIDEAIASWRDDGYPRRTSLLGNAGMASHPYYTRDTDEAAYNFGADFMAYLDGKLNALNGGGLKSFLKYMIENKLFTPYTTEDFASWMSSFYSENLVPDFQKYVYRNSALPKDKNIYPQKLRRAVHKKQSLKDLEKYL
ncbi:MAG: hypothetical protein QE271_11680 [Bacteriovoracaceae bacterium]|nr:hypothetical protein [Bacteriovoracaceae bacterium]